MALGENLGAGLSRESAGRGLLGCTIVPFERLTLWYLGIMEKRILVVLQIFAVMRETGPVVKMKAEEYLVLSGTHRLRVGHVGSYDAGTHERHVTGGTQFLDAESIGVWVFHTGSDGDSVSAEVLCEHADVKASLEAGVKMMTVSLEKRAATANALLEAWRKDIAEATGV